ncbi:MAG: site-specific DNA-methyltransferase [Beijerinckiaceae bacterium]
MPATKKYGQLKLRSETYQAERLAVTYRTPGDLRDAPRNPRVHSPAQIRQIADSIKAFGFNVPVLVDRDDHIIAGHGRVAAARALGLAAIPTIRVEHLTEAEKRAFLIADNRIAERSTWDRQALKLELEEIQSLDDGLDLGLTGFEPRELDLLFDLGDRPAKTEEAPPEPDFAKAAICKPGDVWALGPHRLICGSALEASTYRALLGHRRAGLVFTDPPYNVRIDGHATGNGKIRHREFAMASGEMTEQQFTRFLTEALTRASRVSRDGSIVYVCMDWRHLSELLSAGKSVFPELKNICVWDKGMGGMGSLYRSQHELVAVFKNGTAQHVNNVELGVHGRTRTNVWRYPGVAAQGKKGRDALAMHPTVKPLALVADAIRDASRPGDLVLDPFAGSGTTLLAAHETGRTAALIEIDPHYCDVILERWRRETGGRPVHGVTGEPFSDPGDRASQSSAVKRPPPRGEALTSPATAHPRRAAAQRKQNGV